MKKRGNKGQLAIDMITVVIILFISAVSFIIGYKAISEVNTVVQADEDLQNVTKTNLGGVTANYPTYFDNAFIIMLVLFWIMLIITTLFIDSNPIFFIISIVLLIFVFIVGMAISNGFEDVFSDGDLVTFADAFPKINFVMSNLLIVLIVMGFTASISLYAKNQMGGLV